jgi:hypothetical protein
MPELKEARQELAQAQRDVARKTKEVLATALALSQVEKNSAFRTSGSKTAVKFRTALKTATSLLNSAKSFEAKASQRLAKVIASESVKVSAEVQARSIALFKQQQEEKAEVDLHKAVIRYVAAWEQKRKKLNDKKLARFTRKAAVKTALASRKANAKAKAAVLDAAALSKARTRKAAARASAKAEKLGAKAGSRPDWLL